MFEYLKDFSLRVSEYIIISGVVTIGAVVRFSEWRKSPILPLTACLLGPIFGLFGFELYGKAGGIGATFLGTLAGPGIAAMTQDQKTLRRIFDHFLDEHFPVKPTSKDKDRRDE